MPETLSTTAPQEVCGPPACEIHRQSLFFDFDGTLVDIAATPDSIVVPDVVIRALGRLSARMPGRIAIVSGRSIAQIDAFMGDFGQGIALAGSHGAELRIPGVGVKVAERPMSLDIAGDALALFAREHGIHLERKTLGVGLHYRLKPELEERANALAETLSSRHGLVLQRGKMMVELRAEGDKGNAVASLMALPAMAGTIPLFFGDDLTDEEGFAAAERAGGAGVLIGQPRETMARYRLPDVAAMHDWITAAVESPA